MNNTKEIRIEKKIEKLVEIVEKNYLDIDIKYLYDENDDFDELNEKVMEYINEQEIIYYHKAIKYLSEEDSSLRDSLEIALEFGIKTENLNSELLATLLFQQKLSEQWGEISDEIEEIINQ
jgi:hypothetical protein